jgi:hypothetical protein
LQLLLSRQFFIEDSTSLVTPLDGKMSLTDGGKALMIQYFMAKPCEQQAY